MDFGVCDAGEKRVLKFCVNIIHGTTHTASPECPELSGEEKEGVRSAIREENNFGWKNEYIVIPDNGEKNNIERVDKWNWKGGEIRIIFSLLLRLS